MEVVHRPHSCRSGPGAVVVVVFSPKFKSISVFTTCRRPSGFVQVVGDARPQEGPQYARQSHKVFTLDVIPIVGPDLGERERLTAGFGFDVGQQFSPFGFRTFRGTEVMDALSPSGIVLACSTKDIQLFGSSCAQEPMIDVERRVRCKKR